MKFVYLNLVCSLLLLELKVYFTKQIKALFIPENLFCGEVFAKDGSISLWLENTPKYPCNV